MKSAIELSVPLNVTNVALFMIGEAITLIASISAVVLPVEVTCDKLKTSEPKSCVRFNHCSRGLANPKHSTNVSGVWGNTSSTTISFHASKLPFCLISNFPLYVIGIVEPYAMSPLNANTPFLSANQPNFEYEVLMGALLSECIRYFTKWSVYASKYLIPYFNNALTPIFESTSLSNSFSIISVPLLYSKTMVVSSLSMSFILYFTAT